MTVLADALPDDPSTLKAMLLAERARAERLEQIIKELQRHRFGRRAETLPEDQLLLGLEDVEQIAASGDAEGEAGASAAHRDGGRHRGSQLSVLPQYAAPDRRGSQRTARHHPGATARAGGAPAQVCLSGLRGSGGAGCRAGTADRGRAADRGDGGACARLQICRSSAALSPGQIYARQG